MEGYQKVTKIECCHDSTEFVRIDLINYDGCTFKSEYWHKNDKIHRDGGLPAEIHYKNDIKTREIWYQGGIVKRDGGGPSVILYDKNGNKIEELWRIDCGLGGNVLAYVRLADINDFIKVVIPPFGMDLDYLEKKYLTKMSIEESLDNFRTAVKGPLALEIMRPLPIPIREAIYYHYCMQ